MRSSTSTPSFSSPSNNSFSNKGRWESEAVRRSVPSICTWCRVVWDIRRSSCKSMERTGVPLRTPILLVGKRVLPRTDCERKQFLLADTNVTPGTRTRDRRGPRRTLTTWTRQPRAEKGSPIPMKQRDTSVLASFPDGGHICRIYWQGTIQWQPSLRLPSNRGSNRLADTNETKGDVYASLTIRVSRV
jgi:hypothetical protein